MTFSLRDAKHSLTEQAIIEKGAALFRERGFAQVSVRQIAKAAMVSEKTVFNYFPYKELILIAGVQPPLRAFMTEIQAKIDAIEEPTAVLREFCEKLAALSIANPEATAIISSELLTQDPGRLELAMRYVPDPFGPLRTIMTLARAKGLLRPEISVELATEFFLGNVLNVIRTYFAAGQPDRVPPMLVLTLAIFLHGAFQPILEKVNESPTGLPRVP